MSSPASATASAMMSGLQSRRASEPLSAIPEHRVSVSSPSDNTLNQQSGTIEHKKPWYSFTMRAAIVFLVFSEVALVAAILTALSYTSAQSSNADAVGQGTSSIKALANALQHDASFTVKNHMDSYLRKLYGIGNNTASLVRRGVVNPRDFDTILPLMKDFLVAANVSIMYYHFWINSTLEDVGVGQIMYSQGNFTYDPAAQPSYQIVYFAANKTCTRFCPVQNTGGRITYWFYNETSNQAQGLLSQTAPGFQAWTRPWYKDRLPLGQPFVSPIYFSVVQSRPTIIQSLTFSLWDSSNNFVGVGPIVFSVYDLSRVLDGLKASSTPNSLYYILTPDAEVLAMSGLGADQSTLMRPVGSTYALNSIFTYNDTAYPLLNISSATIFEYSGRNLSRDFVDMEFAVGDFLFQVTSYSFANYKWIIVSGAPATDYLGDTLILQDRLADRLWTVERNIIVSAIAIVIGMSILSVAFTSYFITTPLSDILSAMLKATKFDFSSVREGSLKHKRSAISEIFDTQERFIILLKTFAEALQRNKSLVQGKPATTSGGGYPHASSIIKTVQGSGSDDNAKAVETLSKNATLSANGK